MIRNGVVLALGLFVAMVSIPGCQRPAGVVVVFSDPVLEAAIRTAIAKPTGDIRDINLLELTFLYASNQRIAELEGIQHCVDLTKLTLSRNQIADIGALSGLINLTRLFLSFNEIIDVSALSNLSKLTDLVLSTNKVIDISALSGLPKLTRSI